MVAAYTQGVADKIEQLASALRGRDLPQLARDVEQLARRQPALFIGGAFSVGLIAARFMKSSANRGAEQSGGSQSAFDHQNVTPPSGGHVGGMAGGVGVAEASGYGPAPGGYGPASPTGAHGGTGTFGSDGTGGGPGNNPYDDGADKAGR